MQPGTFCPCSANTCHDPLEQRPTVQAGDGCGFTTSRRDAAPPRCQDPSSAFGTVPLQHTICALQNSGDLTSPASATSPTAAPVVPPLFAPAAAAPAASASHNHEPQLPAARRAQHWRRRRPASWQHGGGAAKEEVHVTTVPILKAVPAEGFLPCRRAPCRRRWPAVGGVVASLCVPHASSNTDKMSRVCGRRLNWGRCPAAGCH